MSLKAHTRPKEERKCKAFYDGRKVKGKDYEKTEQLISLVMCDIINGVSRSDILTKLKEKMYENQKQAYKEHSALEYYYVALNRIKEDREENIDNLKGLLYSQYYQLFNESMEAGNTLTAKSVLDSIAKIFLGDNKNNIQITTTNNDENKVEIKFGYNDT